MVVRGLCRAMGDGGGGTVCDMAVGLRCVVEQTCTAGLLSIARLYAKMNHTAGAVRAFKQYIAMMDQAEVWTRLARQKT